MESFLVVNDKGRYYARSGDREKGWPGLYQGQVRAPWSCRSYLPRIATRPSALSSSPPPISSIRTYAGLCAPLRNSRHRAKPRSSRAAGNRAGACRGLSGNPAMSPLSGFGDAAPRDRLRKSADARCARTNLPSSLAISDLPLGFGHPTGTRGSADTWFCRASEG